MAQPCTARDSLLQEALADRAAAARRRTRSNILWFVIPFLISAFFVFKDGVPASLEAVMDEKSSGVGALMMVFCALVGPWLIPKAHRTMMNAPVENAIPAFIGRRVVQSIRSNSTALHFEELARLGVDRTPLAEVGMLPGRGDITFRNATAGMLSGKTMALMEFEAPQPGRDPLVGTVLWIKPDTQPLQRVHIQPHVEGRTGQGTPLQDPRFTAGRSSDAAPAVTQAYAAAVSAYAGEDDARAAGLSALTVGDALVMVLRRDRPLFDLDAEIDGKALQQSVRDEVFRARDAVKALD